MIQIQNIINSHVDTFKKLKIKYEISDTFYCIEENFGLGFLKWSTYSTVESLGKIKFYVLKIWFGNSNLAEIPNKISAINAVLNELLKADFEYADVFKIRPKRSSIDIVITKYEKTTLDISKDVYNLLNPFFKNLKIESPSRISLDIAKDDEIYIKEKISEILKDYTIDHTLFNEKTLTIDFRNFSYIYEEEVRRKQRLQEINNKIGVFEI